MYMRFQAQFYAIADGEVAVCVDGQPRGVRGRGTGLGEIALLRRVPRTATVTAVGPATLFALDADTFLAAVSGHAPTRRRADQVASRWVTADTGEKALHWQGRSGPEEGQRGQHAADTAP